MKAIREGFSKWKLVFENNQKQKLADVRLVASTANKRANDGPTKKEAIILMDADDIFEGMF